MYFMEKKYTPFIVIGGIVAVLFVVLVFAKLNKNPVTTLDFYNEVSPSAELALDFNSHRHYMFIQDGCSHCETVASYLQTVPDAAARLDLETPNVSAEATRQYFLAKAREFMELCGQGNNNVGTPMLYINDANVPLDKRCLTGDVEIIAYFKSQLGEEEVVLATDGVNEIVQMNSVGLEGVAQ